MKSDLSPYDKRLHSAQKWSRRMGMTHQGVLMKHTVTAVALPLGVAPSSLAYAHGLTVRLHTPCIEENIRALSPPVTSGPFRDNTTFYWLPAVVLPHASRFQRALCNFYTCRQFDNIVLLGTPPLTLPSTGEGSFCCLWRFTSELHRSIQFCRLMPRLLGQ